jgi:hypothetical protein
METLEGFGDCTTGGKIIPILKFADNLVLLAKKETLLHGMINRLMAIGRRFGTEMNVEKPKVIKISRKPKPIPIVQMENLEYFNYLESVITKDESCTRDIKSKTAIAKAALNKKNTGLKLKEKCNIWSRALFGAETWTLQKTDQSTWKLPKCGAGEGWGRSVGPILEKRRSTIYSQEQEEYPTYSYNEKED